MALALRNSLFEAEPFQTSQGVEEPSSPKDLQAFYDDMEKRDVERKKSRGKTRRWSRRGTKDGSPTDKPSAQPPAQQRGYGESAHHEWQQLEKAAAKNPSSDDLTHEADDERAPSVIDMRHDSIIPPRWSYDPPPDAPVFIAPPTQYRLTYKIHNPVGPRFYRNHHLRTFNSSAMTAAHHPPSAFSTSFPPLAALPASSPLLGLGHAHLHPHNRPPQFPSPATSGSSSESVPTPESSQNAFNGPGHEVLRKQNKNASGTVIADPVDQMDGSNPWGQKFHHDSPYDLGKKGKGKEEGSRNATWGGNSSLPGDQPPGTRSRSNTLAPRKTTPSPLSQSTSAVHLQSEGENVPTHVTRKLSKNRRTSGGLKGIFGNSKAASRDSVNALPDTVAMNGTARQSESHLASSGFLKPTQPTNESNTSIASAFGRSPEKDGKRTSILGRMAKRFSFARKPESTVQMSGGRVLFDRAKGKESVVSFASETEKDIWGNARQADSETGLDPVGQKRQQDERRNPGISKRIPPPPIDTEESATSLSPPAKDPPPSTQPTASSPAPQNATSPSNAQLLAPISVGGSSLGVLEPKEREDPHVRDSLMSLDPHPWKLGNLKIANPDLGGSETDLSLRGDGDKHSVSISARMSPVIHAAPQLPAIFGNGDARGASGSPVVGQHKESALPPLPSTPASAVATVGGSEPPLPPTPRAPSPDLPPHKTAELLAAEADIPLFSPPPLPKEETPPPHVEVPPKAESSPRKPAPPLPNTEPLKVEIPSQVDAPPRVHHRSSSYQTPQSQAGPSSAGPSSSTSRHLREHAEHEYLIDVPVQGSLFVRTAPGGGSAPPVEKPVMSPPPLKPRSREPSMTAVPRLRTNSKDTTIFTTIFATPSRSRKASDSSPDKTSSHGHGVVTSPSVSQQHRSRAHLRTGSYSPEKPTPTVTYVRAGSESPDKEGRRERIRDKDYDRERRRDRRVSERESEREREAEDRTRRRERRDSSSRRREKEDSEREQERRKEERAREREERERARERERERDRERGRRKEREREEREREKAKEREKQREREEWERAERQRERERREKEKAREKERMKAMEREKERARELERAREKERERERRREKDSRVERETEKYRLVPRRRTSSFTASSSHNRLGDDTDDADYLVKVSAMGKEWEIVESSRTKRRDRDDRQKEKAQEDGYTTASAIPHRSSTGVRKESSQPNGSTMQLDTALASTSSRSGLRQRAHSLEVHSRSSSTRPPTPPQKDEPRSRRQGEKRSSVPAAHIASTNSYQDARDSTGYPMQRPTSGFPSSSDVAMFKAKEAWERDRMWRGQSMAFSSEAAGGGSVASTSAPVAAGVWGPVSLHDPPVHGQGYAGVVPSSYYHQPPPANHGSSYTSFMVQPAWSHSQYTQPPPPPPIQPYSFEASANPLPAPPRQSTFDTSTPPRTSLVRPTSTEVAPGLRAH